VERSQYERMAAVEERGWWFWGLHRNLVAAWREAASPAPTKPLLLDAGCGTGGLLARIASDLPQSRRFGIEIDPLAAALARGKSGAAVVIGSTLALPVAPGAFDAVFSADVLCHRGVEPAAALQNMWGCLRPGGVLILNLPAYPWLFSGHDRAVDNVRRFARSEVRALLRDAGYARIRIRYWNTVLFPLMVLQRLTHPNGASDVAFMPAPVEHLFRAALALEAWLARHGLHFPFGGSILATAVRP
jgi:SAM-dependent methyltransferase